MQIITLRRNLISDQLGKWPKHVEVDKNAVVSNSIPMIDLKKLKGKTLLLIHGFNCEFDETIETFAEIIENIASFSLYENIIGVTWPSGDKVFEWSDANERCIKASKMLFDVIQFFDNVDIMAHSLGNKLVLEALLNTKEIEEIKIDNFWMLAPAVDADSINKKGYYRKCMSAILNVHIFHSAEDGVLKIVYRLAEREAALGLRGPSEKVNLPNVNVYDCKKYVKDHSGYKRSAHVYAKISREIKMQNALNEFIDPFKD